MASLARCWVSTMGGGARCTPLLFSSSQPHLRRGIVQLPSALTSTLAVTHRFECSQAAPTLYPLKLPQNTCAASQSVAPGSSPVYTSVAHGLRYPHLHLHTSSHSQAPPQKTSSSTQSASALDGVIDRLNHAMLTYPMPCVAMFLVFDLTSMYGMYLTIDQLGLTFSGDFVVASVVHRLLRKFLFPLAVPIAAGIVAVFPQITRVQLGDAYAGRLPNPRLKQCGFLRFLSLRNLCFPFFFLSICLSSVLCYHLSPSASRFSY